jgi:(p)ppGpp synthase/HD superfamily hydrolase
MATLNRAIEIATKAHEGDTDKYGSPYINHVTRVMNMGQDDNEKIVGVLHDVIEDTDWTFEDLEKEGFSKEVIGALRCVTKTSEDEDYSEFIDRVKINPLAVKVKLNDLRDNLDVKRMPEVLEKDLKRLNKYLSAYNELLNSIDHE